MSDVILPDTLTKAAPFAPHHPQSDPPFVEVLSGLGEKGPACIRLWTGRQIWVLDVGFGPEATSPFRPEWLIGADAVFISHDHIDHIGGAGHVIAAGLPIYTTAQTARALPPGADVHILPERGAVDIDGVRLTLGRNGHALGGVWMHFAVGDGVFYSGDWSVESDWFAFDCPDLRAGVALIDCSYHLDDVAQRDRKRALDSLLDTFGAETQVLFPVPPSGRAGEVALHLLHRVGALGDIRLDDTCKAALSEALASGAVAPSAHALRPLLDQPFDAHARYLLCDTPNADGGMAWRIVQDWRDQGRLGREAAVLFTGHMTAHARAIAQNGGYFQRWNVHPPLRDQRAMIDRLGARVFAPLFCSEPSDYLLETAFPARPVLDGRIPL